jgi:hypothetical protein
MVEYNETEEQKEIEEQKKREIEKKTQEIVNLLNKHLCFNSTDIQKAIAHKTSEPLEFIIGTQYKLKFVLKMKTAFDVQKYFADTIKESMDIFNIEIKNLNFTALFSKLLPKVNSVIFDQNMQNIIIDILQAATIYKKNGDSYDSISQDEKMKDLDIFTEDYSMYTKIVISILFIVIKNFFFKTSLNTLP